MATSQILSQASPGQRPRMGWGPRLAYLILFAGLGILAVTGIGTFILGRAPMTHWILMLHVGMSPVFSFGLALVALTWTARCSWQSRTTGLLFWVLMLSGLVVVLSGVLPMTPIFGTEGQHLLYLVHRYGAIVLTVTWVLHFLSLPSRR